MPKRGIELGRQFGPVPHHVAGEEYGILADQNRTTQSGQAGRVFFMPIYIPNTGPYTSINTRVNTQGGASTSLRLGLYADNDGVPGVLLHDSGDIAADSTGEKTSSFTKTLKGRRWYWMALHTEDAVIAMWALQGAAGINQSEGDNTRPTVMLFHDQTYGALDDPAVVDGGLTNTNAMNVWLVRAS